MNVSNTSAWKGEFQEYETKQKIKEEEEEEGEGKKVLYMVVSKTFFRQNRAISVLYMAKLIVNRQCALW